MPSISVGLVGVLLVGACCWHEGAAFCPSLAASRSRPSSSSAARTSSLSLFHNIGGPRPEFGRRRRRRRTSLDSSIVGDGDDDEPSPLSSSSPRSGLRRLTGFSLTAVRSTLRAATGFSLTASRAALRAATGMSLSSSISTALRSFLGVLSPGLRYFLQPFLVLYYAPLLAIRYGLVGPSGRYVEESRRGHERVVEGWRRAVEAAEAANGGGYWPVHLNEDGTIVTSLPPDPSDVLDLDLADGIERSVAASASPM